MIYSKKIIFTGLAALAAILLLAGVIQTKVLPALRPAFLPAPGAPALAPADDESLPVVLPEGFRISVLAADLPGARVIREDLFGNLWVTQSAAGQVALLEMQDGKVVNQGAILRNLRQPHGLAFDPAAPTMLYVAEESRIFRIPVYSEGVPERIADLPSGGHNRRSLGFGPDGRLYVSVGSSCNVCVEPDARQGTIQIVDIPGRTTREFARGLRNAPFFTWRPGTSEMWATEMGRDWLGDDLPPDELNIVREGGNYGWPICYGRNIHDTDFDKNTYIRNPCMEPFEMPSHADIPAHSAPLGLAFLEGEGWPEGYRGDLLVALHGSWNRSAPAGYKIVRYHLASDGRVEGVSDFATGWLSDGAAWGRPVDLLARPDGTLLVTDDKAGVVYRIVYNREAGS